MFKIVYWNSLSILLVCRSLLIIILQTIQSLLLPKPEESSSNHSSILLINWFDSKALWLIHLLRKVNHLHFMWFWHLISSLKQSSAHSHSLNIPLRSSQHTVFLDAVVTIFFSPQNVSSIISTIFLSGFNSAMSGLYDIWTARKDSFIFQEFTDNVISGHDDGDDGIVDGDGCECGGWKDDGRNEGGTHNLSFTIIRCNQVTIVPPQISLLIMASYINPNFFFSF